MLLNTLNNLINGKQTNKARYKFCCPKCVMSYMGTAGSLRMRVWVLTAPTIMGFWAMTRTCWCNCNPGQLNNYFLWKIMHWKKGLKPSQGGKFILAPRTPSRLGCILRPWTHHRAMEGSMSSVFCKSLGNLSPWWERDALWCPSYDTLWMLPPKKAAALRCLFSSIGWDKAVYVLGSGLLWQFLSLSKCWLTTGKLKLH